MSTCSKEYPHSKKRRESAGEIDMRLMERRRQHVVAKGKTADKLPWEIFALSEPANKIESSSHNSCSSLHCASKKKW